MDPVIGIDLGTTNSLCAIFENGQPQLIPNPHGKFLTPSIVGILEDGTVIMGSPAKELQITKPERCASTFKRHMGTDKIIELAGKKFLAPELSSLVLQSLKDDAEKHLGSEVREAVITVPAYFNDLQRRATKQAGEIAGLNVRRIVNEPTAAALTYGFHDRQTDKKLIVIDLGGGTFDVTLMEIFEGTLEIISTAGESFLGGEDFTDRMVATVLQKLGQQLEVAEVKSPLLVSRLRQECENVKRKLTDSDESKVRIPENDGSIRDDAETVSMSRESFATICTPLIERLKKPVFKAIRDADLAPKEIEDVILVGGATRMPIVQNFVRELFNCEPLCTINPDEVVALGSAVQAALIQDNAAVDDMVMTDVCPYTLGVETCKEFGGRIQEGYFVPIISRNTTIPVSKEEVLFTMVANQPEVLLSVYQGESRRVKDNLKLGELRVTGIPPGPKGQPIHIRFTYDMNGILEVEAYVPDGGKKFRTVLTNHAQVLTNAELNAAVKKMQKLKFYPRDDIHNQRLVLFCERVVGEVSPMQRDDLENALDMFEHAMASGEREFFEHARQGLLMMLSSLGFEYDESADQDTKPE